jgi:hypothetical protein
MNNVPQSQIEEFGNVGYGSGYGSGYNSESFMVPGGTPFLTNSGPFPNMFGNVYERFGNNNSNGTNLNTEVLLQVILFILIALFVIQLVEMLYMRCTTGGEAI